MSKYMCAASWMAACSLMLCATVGCGSRADVHRVDHGVAIEVLTDVLQSWKNGEKPEDWQAKSPPVTVQDLEWMRGVKLLDFKVQDSAQAIDANLHCPVKLILVDANQEAREKSVVYLVGTSPSRTVFRSLSP